MRFNAVLLVAGVTFGSAAHARVLDDFSQGTTAVTAQLEASDVSTGLDPSHTIGGERHVEAGGQTSIRINSPSHPGELGAVFPLGLPFFLARGEFTYGANSPLGVNLNDDGAKEFRVILQGAYGAMYLDNASITVTWLDGIGGSTTAAREFSNIFSSGANMTTGSIPFSAFGDLSNASQVALRFDRTMTPGGFQGPYVFSVRSFATAVPEPATLSISIVPAIFLARKRRSRCRLGYSAASPPVSVTAAAI